MSSLFADKEDKICLLPVGKINNIVLEYLQNGLSEVFGKEVIIAQSIDIPSSSYNPTRRQYLSTIILQEMRKLSYVNAKVLGIVDVDLYVPELNFVFGEADIGSGIAIISIIRLRQGYYGLPEDNNLFKLRALKEAVHEIGHLYGFGHCKNSRCIMYFSNSLIDTDRKDFHFCPKCQKNFPSHKHV